MLHSAYLHGWWEYEYNNNNYENIAVQIINTKQGHQKRNFRCLLIYNWSLCLPLFCIFKLTTRLGKHVQCNTHKSPVVTQIYSAKLQTLIETLSCLESIAFLNSDMGITHI